VGRGYEAVPIYEYQCSKCGEVFEAFQKSTDKPLNKCKFCSGKVEKLISQSSFQLKGSGWYLTDYSRKSKSGEKPGKDAGTSGGSSDKSSDTSASKPKADKSTT
jgi:putative FmdB family regulatory protein